MTFNSSLNVVMPIRCANFTDFENLRYLLILNIHLHKQNKQKEFPFKQLALIKEKQQTKFAS